MRIDELFYAMGVVFVLLEISVLFNSRFFWLLHRYVSLMKRMGVEERREARLPPGGLTFVLLDLWYFWWTVCGLFTTQWPLFLLVRVLSSGFHGKRERSPKVVLFDSVLSLVVLFLIYANKFIWRWRLDFSVSLHQIGF